MLTKDKVKAFVKELNMLQTGDHIVIGLSGGADSVCLFYILQSLAKEYDLTLTAVHVEHGIRAKEALQDAEFVVELCKKEGVACVVEHVDIPSLAKQEGCSEEEMGRKIRYEIFEQVARRVGANKIAVAHHKNDVAETMLFHLCRGTGIAGLCAMTPVRGNLIRPLLVLDREEIVAYLQEKQVQYCNDSTNEDTTYTRNYIRKEILPRLKEVNPKVIDHMVQTAHLLEGANDTLKGCIKAQEEVTVVFGENEARIKASLFESKNEYIISGVLHNVIGELAGSKKDIHRIHIQDVSNLAELQVGKKTDLPYGLFAIKEYDGICIKKVPEAGTKEDVKRSEIPLKIPGETVLWDGQTVQTRIFSADEIEDIHKIPDKACTKWFDYDIINGCISVRNRRSGDYMVVRADGGTKKIKELFIHEKVLQQQRDDVVLFAKDRMVLWAVGVRMGEYGKINPETKQVLEIKYMEEEKNE